MALTLEINGEKVEVKIDESTPLLWFLRDHLGLTGTKFGCGVAQCGVCTVQVDGVPRRACVTPLAALRGKRVTTIEASESPQMQALQRQWEELGVPQCGYCQAGQLMSAESLLRKIPQPEDKDIDQALAGNLCRCATYVRIRKAIHEAAKELAEGE